MLLALERTNVLRCVRTWVCVYVGGRAGVAYDMAGVLVGQWGQSSMLTVLFTQLPSTFLFSPPLPSPLFPSEAVSNYVILAGLKLTELWLLLKCWG